jgi:hypothetical protein
VAETSLQEKTVILYYCCRRNTRLDGHRSRGLHFYCPPNVGCSNKFLNVATMPRSCSPASFYPRAVHRLSVSVALCVNPYHSFATCVTRTWQHDIANTRKCPNTLEYLKIQRIYDPPRPSPIEGKYHHSGRSVVLPVTL